MTILPMLIQSEPVVVKYFVGG